MELFFSKRSGNSARVVFALNEAGVAWTPRYLDIRGGETRLPDYLALNPMGKIPTLKDGGLVLWESNAINWYLAETHPQAGLLPSSPAQRAAVLRWQLFQTGHLSPACIPIFRARHPVLQRFWQTKPDPAALEAAEKELARYLPVVEQALAGRQWLEGTFSLADIAFAPHLSLLPESGIDFAEYPRLRGWLDRLLSRPGWKKTAELVFTD
jgi:glutathione S-transferase